MPDDDLKFTEFHKCVDLSDIVYADMESILVKCTVNDDAVVNTHLLQKHIPCCVGSYWISKVSEFVKKNNLPVFTHNYTTSLEKEKVADTTSKIYVECTYRPPKRLRSCLNLKYLVNTSSGHIYYSMMDIGWQSLTSLLSTEEIKLAVVLKCAIRV